MFNPLEVDFVIGSNRPQMPVSGPEGFVVIVSHSEMVPTKEGTGSYLKLTLDVVEGPQTGAQGIEQINLYNQNQQAVEIAWRQLGTLCWCIGTVDSFDPQNRDYSFLHNKMFRVVSSLQDGANGQKGYTNITKYMSYDGQIAKKDIQVPMVRPYGGSSGGANPLGGGVPMGMPSQQPVQPQTGQSAQIPPQVQQTSPQGQFQYPQGQGSVNPQPQQPQPTGKRPWAQQ